MKEETLKDDFYLYGDVTDTKVRALQNESFDLEETYCVCKGFETEQMILRKKQSCTVGWYPYSACMHLKELLRHMYRFLQPSDQTIIRTGTRDYNIAGAGDFVCMYFPMSTFSRLLVSY